MIARNGTSLAHHFGKQRADEPHKGIAIDVTALIEWSADDWIVRNLLLVEFGTVAYHSDSLATSGAVAGSVAMICLPSGQVMLRHRPDASHIQLPGIVRLDKFERNRSRQMITT